MTRMHYGRPIILAFCATSLVAPLLAEAGSRSSEVTVTVQVVNSCQINTGSGEVTTRCSGTKPNIDPPLGSIQPAAAMPTISTDGYRLVRIEL